MLWSLTPGSEIARGDPDREEPIDQAPIVIDVIDDHGVAVQQRCGVYLAKDASRSVRRVERV